MFFYTLSLVKNKYINNIFLFSKGRGGIFFFNIRYLSMVTDIIYFKCIYYVYYRWYIIRNALYCKFQIIYNQIIITKKFEKNNLIEKSN